MANFLDKSGLIRVLQGVKNQIERKVGELEATKGRPNGIASLDGKGFVPLAQLGNLDMTFFEAVQELPTKDIKKHIYLIKNNKEGEQDTYDEYLYIGDIDGEYDASKWEKLGDFVPTFDLKEYAKKKDAVNSISIRDIVTSVDVPDDFELGLYYINGDGEEKHVTIPVVTVGGFSQHPSGILRPYTGHNGLMTSADKAKLDKIDTTALSQSISNANTAADNTNKAIKAAETATAGAEKVDATLTEENVFEVTDRTGAKKTLDLNITADGSVDNTVGTPSVEINQSVENNKQKLSFNFKNMKGDKGERGEQGLQGIKGEPFTYSDFTTEEIKELQKPATDAANELNKYLDIVKLPVVEIPASGTAVAMDANKVYNITISEQLTLTLNTPTDTTITNEYQGSFDTGSTAPTITFPVNVIWAETPQIYKNTHYEFSIRYVGGKYYGVLYGWNLTNIEGI